MPTVLFDDDCTRPSDEVWGRPADAWPFIIEPGQEQLLTHPPRRRLATADQADEAGYPNRRNELGVNWLPDTPFIYEEGQHTVTRIRFCLLPGYQTDLMRWNVIAQQKQVQPYPEADCFPQDASGKVGPALTVNIYGGKLRLTCHWTDRIVSPAPSVGVPHTLALNVRHSATSAGRVRMMLDGVEQGRYDGPNMSYRKSTGLTIPSALRTGIYHDIAYDVPSTIDVYRVRVLLFDS